MALYEDIENAPGQVYDWAKRKFVSLTKPSENDGDYTTRSADIARQQKLADMLSQMGAQDIPVSTAGGISARISPWAAIAKGLQSGAGAYMSGQAASDEAAATAAEKKAVNEERGRIFAMNPAVAATEASQGAYTGDDAEGIPSYAVNAATPRKAASYILTPDEQINAISALGERSNFGAKAADRYLPLAMRRLENEKPKFVPGDKEGIFQLVDGKLVNVVKPRPEATDVPTPSKLAQLQRERAGLIANGAKPNDPLIAQYDAAINIETTRAAPISISTGDTTNKVLQGLDAADLGEYRTKRSAAQTMLSTVQDLKTIDPAKLYTGALADLKTKFSGYATAAGLGGIDLTKLANSETYQAQLANVGIKLVKSLGANPTDTDLKFIMSSLPLLTKQPAARAELLNFLEERAKEDIKNYADASVYYKKNNSLIGFAPTGGKTSTGIPTKGFN